MGTIEELPDDAPDTLPPTAPKVSGPVPEQHQTVDELVKDLKRSPFFMTSLDDVADDEENVALDAIRALQYEGTRAEVAENFKEQGNELVREKKWKDAKEMYGKGLLALRDPKQEKGEGEDGREMKVKELLLVNRALCHLELQNYRSCTRDCADTLSLNPKNVKAHYRLASALFALNKLEQALAACINGLDADPENKAMVALKGKIEAKKNKQDEIDRRKREEEEKKKSEAAMLAAALKVRKIRMRTTGQPPEMEDAAIRLTPDPLSSTSTLTFPVVLLYPVHLQSDFIKAFGEEQSVQGHLEYLLPLPWDKEKEYTVKGVDAYLETVEGGLIKWGKKVELLKVLSGGKVEVVDGLVKVNILPRSRAAEWIETVKKRNNKA